MSTVKKYLSLVKFAHTIFAMPFAMIGFFLGVFKTDLLFGNSVTSKGSGINYHGNGINLSGVDFSKNLFLYFFA